MSLLMDLVAGFVALIGLFVGTLLEGPITRAVSIPYIAVILGLIGLVVAGIGFKKRDWGAPLSWASGSVSPWP